MAKERKKVEGEKSPQTRRKGRTQEEAQAQKADSAYPTVGLEHHLSVDPVSVAPASPRSRIRQADSRAPSQTH